MNAKWSIVELTRAERGNRHNGQWAVLNEGEIVYTSKLIDDCFTCIINCVAFDASPAYHKPRR